MGYGVVLVQFVALTFNNAEAKADLFGLPQHLRGEVAEVSFPATVGHRCGKPSDVRRWFGLNALHYYRGYGPSDVSSHAFNFVR